MLHDLARKVGGYVDGDKIRLPYEIIAPTSLGQVVLITAQAILVIGHVTEDLDTLSARYLSLRN